MTDDRSIVELSDLEWSLVVLAVTRTRTDGPLMADLAAEITRQVRDWQAARSTP